MFLNQFAMREKSSEVAVRRSINPESLERRTLFSAAGFLPAELLEEAVLANDSIATQMERMVPATNNQAATEEFGETLKTAAENGDALAGDLDGDDVVNANDINMLAKAVHLNVSKEKFDLDGDGSVGRSDQDFLVRKLIGTEYGDANLDGRVDEEDFKQLQNSLFSTNHGWQNGDFNGNFRIDGGDFVLWNQYKNVQHPLSQTADIVTDDVTTSDQMPSELTNSETDMKFEDDTAAEATPRIVTQDGFAAQTKPHENTLTATNVKAPESLSVTSKAGILETSDSKLGSPAWRSGVLKANGDGLQRRLVADLNRASARAGAKEANYDLLKTLEEFVM